ncbi:MAG TPA: hypothetical protein VHN80_15020 [Kineosporiaceae bacterium]|nr:hypothetical protein [Kineosporiaceae bacterium]
MTFLPSAGHPAPMRPAATVDPGRWDYLPISAFAVVMGLAGTALAWQRATFVIAAPGLVGELVSAMAICGSGW